MPVGRPGDDAGGPVVGVAGPLEIAEGVRVVPVVAEVVAATVVALVVATVVAAGDDVEDVSAVVAPAGLGAPAEQAAVESAVRPRATVAASVLRIVRLEGVVWIGMGTSGADASQRACGRTQVALDGKRVIGSPIRPGSGREAGNNRAMPRVESSERKICESGFDNHVGAGAD